MASEKDKPDVVPEEKKPGAVLEEKKPDVVPEDKKPDTILKGKEPDGVPEKKPVHVPQKKKPVPNYLERVVRVLNLLIALFTFFTILKEILNPQGIHWIIFGVYIVFIIAIAAWFIFVARNKKRPLWEHGVVVLLSIINTAIFVLWLPTGFNEIKCGFYDIQITSPKPGAATEGTFTVSGSYRFLPPPDSLILINGATEEEKYWPSSFPIQVNQTLGTWSGVFYLGGETGSKANVDIALVGRSGRALYEYYLQVGKDTGGQWPAIRILPNDIKICGTVEVVKK